MCKGKALQRFRFEWIRTGAISHIFLSVSYPVVGLGVTDSNSVSLFNMSSATQNVQLFLLVIVQLLPKEPFLLNIMSHLLLNIVFNK